MITVTLPDGRTLDVETDDENVAASAAHKFATSIPAEPVRKFNDRPSTDGWGTWAAKRVAGGVLKIPASTAAAAGVVGAASEAGWKWATNDKSKGFLDELGRASFTGGGYENVQKHLDTIKQNFHAAAPLADEATANAFLDNYMDTPEYVDFVNAQKTALLGWSERSEQWANETVGETRRPDQMTAGDEFAETVAQAATPLGWGGAVAKGISSLPRFARIPARVVEAALPTSMPYTKANVALNVGVGGTIDTAIREATGQPSIIDANGGRGEAVAAGGAVAAGIGALAALQGKPRSVLLNNRQMRLPDGSIATGVPGDVTGAGQRVTIRDSVIDPVPYRDFAKAILDNTALFRSERRMNPGTYSVGDVDAIAQNNVGAVLQNKVMHALRTGQIAGVGDFSIDFDKFARARQMLSDAEYADVDAHVNAQRAIQVRENAMLKARDELANAAAAYRASPSAALRKAVGEAQAAYKRYLDDDPDVRVMLPQFSNKDLGGIIAKQLPTKLHEFINLGRANVQAVTHALERAGVITSDVAQSFNNQYYTGKMWQDPYSGLSFRQFMTAAVKSKINPSTDSAKRFRTLSRGHDIEYMKPAEDMITNPVDFFEANANYARAMVSLIYRNQLNRQVLHGTNFKTVPHNVYSQALDADTRYVRTYVGGKEHIYDLKDAPHTAALLNGAPDAIGLTVGLSQLARVWFQRGTTGALMPAVLGRQITQSIGSALALSRAGSGVNPWMLAKGFVRAGIGSMGFAGAVPVQAFRKTLLNSPIGRRMVTAFGGDPAKLDDALAGIAHRMEDTLLKDMMRVGLEPSMILGHYTEAITGMRSMERALVGSRVPGADLVTAPIKMWIRMFEGIQSYSRVAILHDQTAKLVQQYGSIDRVPPRQLAKMAQDALNAEGDVTRMAGSQFMRNAQRTIPYFRTVTAGINLLLKRVSDALGMTPGIKRTQQFEAMARLVGYGMVPAVATAFTMSGSPGTYNYYWNVLTPEQRYRTMFIPRNVETWTKMMKGEYAAFNPQDFWTIPATPDFGMISGPFIEFLAKAGAFGDTKNMAKPPEFWATMRQTFGDIVGPMAPMPVQIGSSALGLGRFDVGRLIKEGSMAPGSGGDQIASPSEEGNMLPQLVRDAMFATFGTAGAALGEGINTGYARAKEKTGSFLSGTIEEILSQNVQRLPDLPGVWNYDERVIRTNTTAKANGRDDKALQAISRYRTDAMGNPKNPFPYGQESVLLNQITSQLGALTGSKTRYGELEAKIKQLNHEIELRNSLQERARRPASERRDITTSIHTQLVNAQLAKRAETDRILGLLRQQHGAAYRQWSESVGASPDLTLEGLAEVTQRLRAGTDR